jgi:hypothetical protein
VVSRVDRVAAGKMSVTCVPRRWAAEIHIGPQPRVLRKLSIVSIRVKAGNYLVGGSTVCVQTGLSVCVCVCVCVWAGLVYICSPRLENIFVRNNLIS